MIGGAVLIPIRGVNDEIVEITTTPKNLKPGTYAKFIRGIQLQKELIVSDLKIDGVDMCFSASSLVAPGQDTSKKLNIGVRSLNAVGTAIAYTIYITNTDTIYRLAS